MVGGRRCRKSTLLLVHHAETAIQTAGVQTAYVAPVERGLADYIAPILAQVFNDCPADLMPRYREKYNDLLFPNESRVIFNGSNMRQYRYMRGQKLKLASVDEFSEIDDLESAVDDVLFPAVWDSHGEMVLSGTPPAVPSPDHPVMRYVATAKLNDSYWHASIYDAGYTKEEIAEALRETAKGEIDESEAIEIVKICDPKNNLSVFEIYAAAERMGIRRQALVVFLREFMAEFIRDESAVIVPEFDEKLHMVSIAKPVYYDMLYKGSGADLGVADKTVEIFGYYDFQKAKAVVESEFWIEGADVRTDVFATKHLDCVEKLGWRKGQKQDGASIMDPRATFWSDNSNLMLLNDLRAGVRSDKDPSKFVIEPIYISPTDKEDKAQWLNLIRIMFKQGRILIDPSCKLLLATLNGAFWRDSKKLDYGRSKALGHMDALDGLIYFIRNLNIATNPFPNNYDLSRGVVYDTATHIYPDGWDKRAHTEEGRVLERVFGKNRFNRSNGTPTVMGGL